MFENNRFYFGTIRKIVSGVGAVFNGIKIARYSDFGANGNVTKIIDVPFGYGPRQNYLRAKDRTVSTFDGRIPTKVEVILPRITYELTGINYDPTRQVPNLMPRFNKSSENPNVFLKQLQKTPYDFSFSVYVATKNIEDGLQILEQILPNFTPQFNIMIEDIPEMNIVSDVPVIYTGIQMNDNWEDAMNSTRQVEWTLDFVAKGYLYPSISDAGLIRRVIANFQNHATEEQIQTMTTEIVPFNADIDSDYEIRTTIEMAGEDEDGGDSNGDSNSEEEPDVPVTEKNT